ncbi:MAG: hypothetical protein WCC46_06855 [Terriglobales bacterium]
MKKHIRKNLKNKNDKKKDDKQTRVVRAIRALPPGTVSTYGAIAKAAAWPGAGGAIKLRGEHAAEQRFRLQMEGVTFRGARVDMKRHEFQFPSTKAKSRNAAKPR